MNYRFVDMAKDIVSALSQSWYGREAEKILRKGLYQEMLRADYD